MHQHKIPYPMSAFMKPDNNYLPSFATSLSQLSFFGVLLGILLLLTVLFFKGIASPKKEFRASSALTRIPDVTNPNTKLIIVTNFAVANGSSTNSVEAHIVDVLGNPVTNQQVVFTINGATGGVGANTDANGYAVITLTSTIAGVANITAKVLGLPIVFGSPAQVVF